MAFNTGAALLDALVLSVVGRESTYGYKITQDVRGVMHISESTLYPVLRRQPNGVLWVLLAVVTCPVWLGLLGGLIGLVMGVFGALAGVTGAGVAAAVAGALHAASGVVLLAASPMDAFVRLGGGLFCVGLGILMTGGGVWLITKAVRAGIALWQRAARLWRGKAVR